MGFNMLKLNQSMQDIVVNSSKIESPLPGTSETPGSSETPSTSETPGTSEMPEEIVLGTVMEVDTDGVLYFDDISQFRIGMHVRFCTPEGEAITGAQDCTVLSMSMGDGNGGEIHFSNTLLSALVNEGDVAYEIIIEE
jgi:hypothetical protein